MGRWRTHLAPLDDARFYDKGWQKIKTAVRLKTKNRLENPAMIQTARSQPFITRRSCGLKRPLYAIFLDPSTQ